ncbi:hypothetical protein [Mesorhizobium sp. WSM2239]|uniref:D-serine dehydratase-like domain-containing protein n=2 Tax=unclassified Mesorhizobium TaxID=325217 RepID=A0AAU8DHN5_9HYPH
MGKRRHLAVVADSRHVVDAVSGVAKEAGAHIRVPVECDTGGGRCGSPDMWKDDSLTPVTEYRAGTYIYDDRALLSCGAASLDQCAMTVLAMVVTRPTADRAIADAGSKALTSDLMGPAGYGQVLEHPDAVIYRLNAEHGLINVSRYATSPKIGDRVYILPNHTCVVSNLSTGRS